MTTENADKPLSREDFLRILDEKDQPATFTWWTLGDNSSVAVCSYCDKVAKITTSKLKRMVVRDTHVIPGRWCEEQQRCWAVSCLLNTTTRESLATDNGGLSRIPLNWEVLSDRLTRLLQNAEDSAGRLPPAHSYRKPLRPGKRFRILERDGFRCRLCGESGETTKLHIDHIIPVSLGGTDDDDNLQVTCQNCNLGKSNRLITPDE